MLFLQSCSLDHGNKVQPSIIHYKNGVISQHTFTDHVFNIYIYSIEYLAVSVSFSTSLYLWQKGFFFFTSLHYFSQFGTEWNVCAQEVCLVKVNGEFLFGFAGFVFLNTCFILCPVLWNKICQHYDTGYFSFLVHEDKKLESVAWKCILILTR